MKDVTDLTNEELADCIASAKLAPAKYLEHADLLFHGEAIMEAAKRLRAQKHWCPDKECACHHDGHHDRLLPCPMPNCGAPARIYTDASGRYFVECTKCGHRMTHENEVTEYWAALFWNEAIKKTTEDAKDE